jgi:hypothetical protein
MVWILVLFYVLFFSLMAANHSKVRIVFHN